MTALTTMMIALIAASAGAFVKGFFDRRKDNASANKTNAEARDILTQASERALGMMEMNLRFAQERIIDLEKRVLQLEEKLQRYNDLHGPLPPPLQGGRAGGVGE